MNTAQQGVKLLSDVWINCGNQGKGYFNLDFEKLYSFVGPAEQAAPVRVIIRKKKMINLFR